MKKPPIQFQPFRLNPKPPVLPQWIVDACKEGIAHANATSTTPFMAGTLQGMIEASGLRIEELCERMQKPGAKTQITPEFLAEALADDMPESWVQMRILKALGISWDDYERVIHSNIEASNRAHQVSQPLRDAYAHYQRYGPRVHALVKDPLSKHVHGTDELLRLHRLLKLETQSCFDPPTAETMAQTIATSPDLGFPPLITNSYTVAGYRYYRLPDEVHDFDLQGNHLASGRPHLEPPPGLQIPQIHACCGGVIRPKVKHIPGAPKPVR